MRQLTRFYLQTYGCQMNVYEAGVVRRILADAGLVETKVADEADVLLLMTCSVRSHAEARALGRLGTLRWLRAARPGRLIGVLGCMAQRYGRELVTNELVDLVVGPDCYRQLPGLLNRLQAGEQGLVCTELGNECYDEIQPWPDRRQTAFVTIMRGCDNNCSYCIVPLVKGRARSRPIGRVLAEVAALIESGVKDITLLGQNVLAYSDAGHDFVALLEAVDRIAGSTRIRFLTSHPRDFDERVIAAMERLGSVCPGLHLPLQSGSDRILRLMNRGYTRAEYVAKVQAVRSRLPELVLSTDIIVGFPTETKDDFAATLDLVQELRFDSAYMYRYSERPGTQAAQIEPRVPEAEAGSRLARLIEVQNRVTRERNRQMVGQDYQVLIEEPSRRGHGWLGRTRGGKPVIVNGRVVPGALVKCRVTHVKGWTPVAECQVAVTAAG